MRAAPAKPAIVRARKVGKRLILKEVELTAAVARHADPRLTVRRGNC